MKSDEFEYLSVNFKRKEFECKHCGKQGIKSQMVWKLEELRGLVSRANRKETPLYVTSGYRCPQHPVEARKPKPGYHSLGIAADVYSKGLSPMALYLFAIQIDGINGLGVNKKEGYLHVDLRPVPARWLYDDDGMVIPWK